MATNTANLVHDNSSLANFQSWSNFIYQSFVNFGWIQTSDTGQTIPSNTTSVGTYYFIFRMNDTLQSSCPTFVKVTYGNNSSTVQVKFQVGQGTDGAGNLTGALSNQVFNSVTSNQGVTTYPCYASGDAGSIRFMMWQSGSANVCFCFGVERSKDASGNNTASFVTCVSGDAQNIGAPWMHMSLVAGNPNPTPNYTNGNGWFTAMPNVTGYYNGQVAAFPLFPMVGQIQNPMLDWVTTANQDVTEGANNITVNIYGANHNYIATKQTDLSRTAASGNGVVAILMRYE